MRLHRLEIEGFGPFRSRQFVDFDAFAADGIFLIAGRTGAGKSSILDAVCFGLYGSVPRYDKGADKRLRSDHCEPEDVSEVVVEFSTSAGRFRVTRSPEYMRPAKRGGGLTKQPPQVVLETMSDSAWVALAARAVDVGHELAEILQLNQQQFLQVILLAQNRFAQFLLADSKERQSLLRTLFTTERFGDIQARFDDRRRASEQALNTRSAVVTARIDEAERVAVDNDLWGDPHGDHTADSEAAAAAEAPVTATTAEQLSALAEAQSRARHRSERRILERDSAAEHLARADKTLDEARVQRTSQVERERARAALLVLDAEQPLIAESQRVLQRARSAENLRPLLSAVTRAEAAQVAAASAESAARLDWASAGISVDETPAALRSWVADRTQELGSWARAAELETASVERAAELAIVSQEAEAASARLEGIETARAALPTQIADLTEARDTERRAAERIDEIRLLHAAAMVRADAAAEAERLGLVIANAETALAAASDTHTAAQATLSQLRQRRLDGFAGELASNLVDSEACLVCGSTEHPAPADYSDLVSAEDIARAEAVRDAAAQRERDASEHVSTLRADHAVSTAKAEGRSVATAADDLADVTAQEAAAAAATERQLALHVRLQTAKAREAAIEQERTDAAQSLASARERAAVLEQGAKEADAQIAAARGDFASVAERQLDAVANISAATAFAKALDDSAQSAKTVDEAQRQQAAGIADSPFDSPAEVNEALRSESEQNEIDRKITAHAVQREKERQILLPLELALLPDELVNLEPVEAAAVAAKAAWIDAVDTANRTVEMAARLDRLVTSAAEEHEQNAQQSAEHEILRNLAATLGGSGENTRRMTLETFVLAAELEDIVAAANLRLNEMSGGRYQLQYTDQLAGYGAASGLGILVFDAFTGQSRSAQSLSGGETFLGSLALALGLAEVVTARAGGIHLDTMFIDEGFGSLDSDTLELAMRTLDALRQGGRTVGVISHVEAMQEQIPAQLTVRASADGSSLITQGN